MKIVTVLLMICLISIGAAPVWPQNGSGPLSRVHHGSRDCMRSNANLTTQQLSLEEERWLLYMREEEKLAWDVYQALYEQWQLSIFDNIAASEERHFNAIGILMDRYGLTDPEQPQPGFFANDALQDAYGSLISMGMDSLLAALEVGAQIKMPYYS